MRQRRTRVGATLVEVMFSVTLSTLVLGSALAMMYAGMRSWSQGQSMIDAEGEASQSVRALTMELRESMSVVVSADGSTITYRMPRRDANGIFLVPAQWDGVSRRVLIQSLGGGFHSLRMGVAGNERVLSRRIVLTDPDRVGSPTYRPFTAGPGTITRQITIQLITSRAGESGRTNVHRVRETLLLRNIPSITQ